MDAPVEDSDLWVQKNSSELLEELLKCMPQYMYRSSESGKPIQSRTSMTGAAISHVTRLLEMFQEWPQLLDPRLEDLIKPLNDSFLLGLRKAQGNHEKLHLRKESKFCLPQAICKILYTLCKIRGSKVIVRFLSNEARYLEPILDALETWSASVTANMAPLVWEERYVLLLWLSHLALTPFDLSTVGSEADTAEIEIEGLVLSSKLPHIAQRLVNLAVKNLSSASKERESAALTLVRLALRPDLQRLDLHKDLITWAILQLHVLQKSQKQSGYLFVGLLNFLAAMIKSADATTIGPFLLHIFKSVEQFDVLQSSSSSALTRKAVIKVYRNCSVTAINLEIQPDEALHLASDILEPVIEELLTALADNDTPVRQAASKSLSVIATKLDPMMAADVSEAVIASLEEGVLWESVQSIILNANFDTGIPVGKQRNLSLVNGARWQGLVLTLAQLLFRRCPPVSQLPALLNGLILAINFEQRSPTGASLGTNVRDAACFGIWATVRRYSTEELLSVDIASLSTAEERKGSTNIIELLAIELLVAATMDPAGNIRRGASAALQELIGRHSDIITHGIPLIQTVDYHAVALRSRAMIQIAVDAATLDQRYWESLSEELTTWRGIGSADVESRRSAAEALGRMALLKGSQGIKTILMRLWRSLYALDGGTVQKRQGFLLGLAALVEAAGLLSADERSQVKESIAKCWSLFGPKPFVADEDLIGHISRPELTSEAVSALISALSAAVGGSLGLLPPDQETARTCLRYLSHGLEKKETIVLQNATHALGALFPLLDTAQRQEWMKSAFQKTTVQVDSLNGNHSGYLLALGSIYSSSSFEEKDRAAMLEQILQAAAVRVNIDTRLVALRGLNRVITCSIETTALGPTIISTLITALQDYTTDQRGDIGSTLRLAAIEIAIVAFNSGLLQDSQDAMTMLQCVVTLAGEKLDKVRARAWHCLRNCLAGPKDNNLGIPVDVRLEIASKPPTMTTDHDNVDGKAYFVQLLELFKYQDLRLAILQGIAGSIAGGSESVLLSSRAAMIEWLHKQESTIVQAFAECFYSLISGNLDKDRVLTAILETLVFILDSNIFLAESSPALRSRKLFILIQKAHFKSNNMAKLLAAVEIYGHFATVEDMRPAAVKKLTSLLAHPFARVRNAAADVLFVVTEEQGLRPIDWADSIKFTKQALANVKESLQVV